MISVFTNLKYPKITLGNIYLSVKLMIGTYKKKETIITMNSLNYIGSKKSLIDNIIEVCETNIKPKELKEAVFGDLFAGTGIVGFNFNGLCKQVISNDLEYFSFVINRGLLKCNYSSKLESIIEELNSLSGVKGLVYKNFSQHKKCERMFFTPDNAMKCDAIRQRIEKLFDKDKINNNEYYFLLASLIVSVDKVANTSCVYGAYLKTYKKSALKEFVVEPIHKNKKLKRNKVYNKDINELVKTTKFDIVYLDPPYNQRQYGGNYSPLNYIAKYEDVELTGKTGLMKNYNKSEFCSKAKVKNAFKELIDNIDSKHIILSYNNEGLLDVDEMKEILLKRGNVTLHRIKYKKFKAQKIDDDVKYVYEYLWFVDTRHKYQEIDM